MMRLIHRSYGLGISYLLAIIIIWQSLDEFIAENSKLVVYNQGIRDEKSHIASYSPTVCNRIGANDDQAFLKGWEKLKERILKVSLLDTDWSHDLRSNPSFQQWVKGCVSYFTYLRLQRTGVSRPLDENTILTKARSIIEQKIKNPETAEPFRILVFGGSVTAGHQCLSNIFDYKIRKNGRDDTNTAVHLCAWPGRLQDIFDEILGADVVEIINMAVGGASTDISTAVMEFGMVPGDSPDIIIWDHGSNDAAEYLNSTQVFQQKLQPFYQATLGLSKSCNNTDAPIVILLDTLLGDQIKFPFIQQSISTSAAFWQMIAWYPNVWGISYSNTVRPYVLSNLESDEDILQLLGSKGLFVHPGMMYHITVAWVVAFNILHALHDNCVSPLSLKKTGYEVSSLNGHVTADHLPSDYIPELSDKLQLLQVKGQWNKRVSEKGKNLKCSENNQTPIANSDSVFSTSKCYYAWMVNRVAKITTQEHVNQALEPYLVATNGWKATGFPIKKPHTGWYASGRDSWFELVFNAIPPSVRTLHVIYMKSYSEKWHNATVSIDCSIGIQTEARSKGVVPPTKNSSAASAQYFLSGYHVEETSILVPAKYQLPSISIGSTETLKLTLKFRLVVGETFKITGIGLC
jgi:hypothetical protein